MLPAAAPTGLNTTIGVVAVDADLSKAECRRLAVAAQDGLARAVRPAHSMFDGDTVFAVATQRGRWHRPRLARWRGRSRWTGCARRRRRSSPGRRARRPVGDGAGGLPAYQDIWPTP